MNPQAPLAPERSLSAKLRAPNRSGFTLVELMMVVAIIAILASIAIAGYSKWVDQARQSRAETFLALIKAKQETYRNRFGTYALTPPNPSNIPAAGDRGSWVPQEDWRALGADPGTNKVEWQYETRGGASAPGDCADPAGVSGVCAGFPPGAPWFWASARNTQYVLMSSSLRSIVWKVDLE